MEQVRRIAYGDGDYRQVLALRDEVLRKPLGLSVFDEDIESEQSQQVYGLFIDGALVACLMIVPVGAEQVKLRQMAVAPASRGQGFGSTLMAAVEEKLRDAGIKSVTLHARSSATAFYAKLGYRSHGQEFQEVGLPHMAMSKQLSD